MILLRSGASTSSFILPTRCAAPAASLVSTRYQQFYMERVTPALMSTKWLIIQQFHMHQQFYMQPVTSVLMSTKQPITGFILGQR
jgi:hypothetical protein